MKRIFISNLSLQAGQHFYLPEKEVHHLKVSRVRGGDKSELMNGLGQITEGVLEFQDQKRVLFKAQTVKDFEKPKSAIVLCQSILQGAPFEEILEHSIEMGLTEFHPLITERTQVSAEKLSTEAKQNRYKMIAAEACKQSGNPFSPQIFLPKDFKKKLQEPVLPGTLRMIGSLDPKARPILDLLQQQKVRPLRVEIFIGPEGGWTENEESEAFKSGIHAVNLGAYTLRAKTASLAFLSIISCYLSKT